MGSQPASRLAIQSRIRKSSKRRRRISGKSCTPSTVQVKKIDFRLRPVFMATWTSYDTWLNNESSSLE